MPKLYIIAGCNGAGKTTAGLTILPEILNCHEFINADIIAAELSPANPELAALEAGRLMLKKIRVFIKEQVDFAFETTLATRSYISLIKNVKARNYEVILLYYWLPSPTFAKVRVASRVAQGGHCIPSDVIERRYHRGIYNLINLYIPICDNWLLLNNMTVMPETIALGTYSKYQEIKNIPAWEMITAPNSTYAQ